VEANPASSSVTVRKEDADQAVVLRGNSIQLLPGTYVVTVSAPGYVPQSVMVALGAGQNRTLQLALPRRVRTAPTRPVAGTMSDWMNPTAWQDNHGWLVHKGGGYVLYGITPTDGVFNFTARLFQGRRLQWVLDYIDERNHLLFQLDKDRFVAASVVNGVRRERASVPRRWDKRDYYGVRLEVSKDRIVTLLYDDKRWTQLDTWAQSDGGFTDGKFGFLIPGSDEVGIFNFQFTRKAR
jgi:hypothetical protein